MAFHVSGVMPIVVPASVLLLLMLAAGAEPSTSSGSSGTGGRAGSAALSGDPSVLVLPGLTAYAFDLGKRGVGPDPCGSFHLRRSHGRCPLFNFTLRITPTPGAVGLFAPILGDEGDFDLPGPFYQVTISWEGPPAPFDTEVGHF